MLEKFWLASTFVSHHPHHHYRIDTLTDFVHRTSSRNFFPKYYLFGEFCAKSGCDWLQYRCGHSGCCGVDNGFRSDLAVCLWVCLFKCMFVVQLIICGVVYSIKQCIDRWPSLSQKTTNSFSMGFPVHLPYCYWWCESDVDFHYICLDFSKCQLCSCLRVQIRSWDYSFVCRAFLRECLWFLIKIPHPFKLFLSSFMSRMRKGPKIEAAHWVCCVQTLLLIEIYEWGVFGWIKEFWISTLARFLRPNPRQLLQTVL